MSRNVRERNAILIATSEDNFLLSPSASVFPTKVLPIEKGDGLWVPSYDKDVSDPLSGSHGSKETTVITDFAQLELSLDMKLPEEPFLLTELFQMCGLLPTRTPYGVSYGYQTSNKSVYGLQQIGERKTTTIRGARGNMKLSAETGKAAELSFDIKAELFDILKRSSSDVLDNDIPTCPSFNKSYLTKNCSYYLVNGSNARFKKVEFNLGAEVVMPKDTCNVDAYTVDIKPELSVTMSITEDVEDSFNELVQEQNFVFVIPFFSEGIKVWEIVIPNAVVIDHKTPTDNGLLTLERTFECRKTLGDDNFELRYYDPALLPIG